jgi:hypothetical protein
MITKSVKTAAGQHDASRRPQTRPRWELHCIECGTEIGTTRRPFRSGHVRRQNNYRQESTRRPLSSLLLFASWARGLECLYTDFRDFTLLRHTQLASPQEHIARLNTFTRQLSYTLRLLQRQITSFIRITLVLPGQHTTCHLVLLLRAQKLMLHF